MWEWVIEVVPVVQLLLNTAALAGGAIVWRLYVANLRAAVQAKDATIETVEKSRDLWRDKAEDLAKRSPEVVEKSLAERIEIRDGEIARLKADKETDTTTVRSLEVKKAELEQDLFRAQGFRTMLALEDGADHNASSSEFNDELELAETPKSIQVEFIGEVAVDSGQLMVTDPSYVDKEWRRDSFQLVREVERTEDAAYNYSYNGACNATLNGEGHGQLAFALGNAGAGVTFSTAWGDGMYPVYAEKHDGRIVRVYVSVG